MASAPTGRRIDVGHGCGGAHDATGHALVVNSAVQAIGGFDAVANTDAITNAGELTLVHASVSTVNAGTGSDGVTTTGSGVGKAKSSSLYAVKIFRGATSVTPLDCGGTALTSQGYNFAPSSCGLTESTDLVDLDFDASPGTSTPSATSPLVDAIPPGINGCGTDFATDIEFHARPLDGNGNGNGDGVLGCDIGAYERAG
jgi:hypothetical protein